MLQFRTIDYVDEDRAFSRALKLWRRGGRPEGEGDAAAFELLAVAPEATARRLALGMLPADERLELVRGALRRARLVVGVCRTRVATLERTWDDLDVDAQTRYAAAVDAAALTVTNVVNAALALNRAPRTLGDLSAFKAVTDRAAELIEDVKACSTRMAALHAAVGRQKGAW